MAESVFGAVEFILVDSCLLMVIRLHFFHYYIQILENKTIESREN